MRAIATVLSSLLHRPQLGRDQESDVHIPAVGRGELRGGGVIPGHLPRACLVGKKTLGVRGAAAGGGFPDKAFVVTLVAEVDGARPQHCRFPELVEARLPPVVRLHRG